MSRRGQSSVLFATVLWLVPLGCGGSGGFGPTPDGGDIDAGANGDGGGTADAGPYPIGELGPGVSTLVGYSEPGRTDGPRGIALLNNPVNVAVGPDGFLYVCDFDNSTIRKISTEGETVTFTESPLFRRPFGITFTSDGDLYVQTDRTTTDAATGSLWRINSNTGAASLVANDFGRMRGMATLSDGRLVVADYQAHTISIYDPDTSEKTVLAGEHQAPGFMDGTGALARFHVPYDVAVSPDDDIYVVDHTNHSLRKVTLAGEVTTVLGDGIPESLDGALDSARLNFPKGIARDSTGLLYITDTGSGTVRRVDLEAGVTTIAGSGTPGFADHTDPLQAQFFAIEGIDVDADDMYLYLADGNNGESFPYNRIRRLQIGN